MNPAGIRLEVGEKSVVVAADQVALIGRTDECALMIEDGRVSRTHARVSMTPQGWMLEDLSSTGGTWLDNTRVEQLVITAATEVRLGDAVSGPVLRLAPHDDGLVASGATRAAQPHASLETMVTVRPPTGIFTAAHTPQQTTRIGRETDNDIVVADLLVSRHHAEIRSTPTGFEIVDSGSANGTFVNGQRVQAAPLNELDLIAIGHTLFRLADGRLEEFHDTGEVTFEAVGISATTASGHRLLNDISFSMKERTLLAVVGPSGSGKSSLLAALSGLRPANEGQVLYGGRDLYDDYAELQTRIGFVPQEDVLHRELTVRATLEYAGRLRFPLDVTAAEAGARIDELLVELGIAHRDASPLHRLSGGERKRTNVVSELLTKPSLLFLDEPTAGLDPGIARVLMQVLRELADGGRTVVVVTHEIANLDICDRLLVLAPGGVPAYFGPPELAAARFGREALSEVFSDLASQPPETWRIDAATKATPPTGRQSAAPELARPARRNWWSQLATLTARNFAVLAADRRNAALLLLQAPVLGLLLLAALPAGELSVPGPSEVRFVSVAGLVLFVLVLAATWVGANNATREIAREVAILKRERAVGLSLSAYVVSKAIVLSALTIVQSVVLVAIAIGRQRGPVDAVLLGSGRVELIVIITLAGLAAMAVGLFVSAVAGSPERASTLLPMILILQLLLSAGVMLPEIVDKPVLRELSVVSSAQWGVAGAASTTDLNSLQLFDDRLRELRTIDAADPSAAVDVLLRDANPSKRWEHSRQAWLTAAGALIVLTIVPLGATRVALRRYDPGR